MKPVFIDYDDDSFYNAITLSYQPDEVEKGDITDYSVHGCPAIVNTANTELEVGTGVSGAIARSIREASAKLGGFDDKQVERESRSILGTYKKTLTFRRMSGAT